MCKKWLLVLLIGVVAIPVSAMAQAKPKLALLIRDIYGPNGLTVDSEAVLPDGSTHSGHFNSGFQSEFTQFNVAIASQLSALPLPSPASGFTYTFDTTTGTFKRSTQSFGPILSDRAETIGKGRLSFGVNYQQFTFDSIEGIDLSRVPAVFTHDDYELGGGRSDVVTTLNSIEASLGQFTTFLTFGITDRLDISLAVPVVRTRLNVVSDATIQRIGTANNTKVHFFRDPDNPVDPYGNERRFYSSGSATGMGDIIVRAKGTLFRNAHAGLALGADVRVPSGDEKNLLGAGGPGVKPFAALSLVLRRFSPHVNVAYQWNGSSELAGDVKTGQKGDLPDQLVYVAGFDWGVDSRVTLAFDVLGQNVIDSPQLYARTFTATNGVTSETFSDIGFRTASFQQVNGSVGIKTNFYKSLLVNFNLLFKLNDHGLRDKVTPLIGLEYGF